MTPSELRWHTIILIAICWAYGPRDSWGQSSPPIPRCSSTTEQHLHEEVRYLQEETISAADRTDQLMARSPSSNGMSTDDNTQNSSTTVLPTHLRQGQGVGMMPSSVH
ncbi:MAG: hypothetical protein KF682_22440 [Nitrospira sp.]|nr:hypothetical protein [Nitrospira sp.]